MKRIAGGFPRRVVPCPECGGDAKRMSGFIDKIIKNIPKMTT